MLNRDVRARRQALPQAELRHSLTAPGREAGLDLTTKKEGVEASTSEEKAD